MSHIQTRAVLASRGNEHGAIVPPLHPASTFEYDPHASEVPYQYQRVSNPTRTKLEEVLANLDGTVHAATFSTGMAATAAVLSTLSQGDRVIVHASVYGGTHRYASDVLPRYGVDVRFTADPGELTDDDFTDATTMVFIETPSNPTLRVVDIRRAAELAHRHGAILVVDNTFMTSYLQRPHECGADVVVQSATKFLGGHSDLLAGVITTNDDALGEAYHCAQKTYGGVVDPAVAHRLIQSLKTFPLRLREQQDNTRQLIDLCRGHEAISRTYYPGWFSDNEAAIHASQADGPGAVFSIEFREGVCWQDVIGALEIPAFAVSLGDVSTLVCHPVSSTHEDMDEAARREAGLSDRLIRISVGIENIDDLIKDFTRAFDAALQE